MCKELEIVGDNIIFRGYEVAKINKNQYASILGDFIDTIKSVGSLDDDLDDEIDDLADKIDDLADDIDDLAHSLRNTRDTIRDFVNKLKGEE